MNVQGLNLAIAELQQLSGKRDENKQSADHSHTVVDNLRSRLKDATLVFKDVLTLRTESLKVRVWVWGGGMGMGDLGGGGGPGTRGGVDGAGCLCAGGGGGG